MTPSERGKVVEFIRQSAELQEPRKPTEIIYSPEAPPPVFRPRADRGDALVDSLRTGIAHALARPTMQTLTCPVCGGSKEIESQMDADGFSTYDSGPDFRVERCWTCDRDGEVHVEACVHGVPTAEDGKADCYRCPETMHYFLGPVGEGDECREIAVDPFAEAGRR